VEELVNRIRKALTPAQEVPTPDGNYLVAVADDHNLKDLEQFQDRPNRVRQNTTFEDLDSFIAYVNRYALRNTVLYVSEQAEKAVAFIDHHHKPVEVDEDKDFILPEWGDHKAVFGFPKTPEWKTWMHGNRKAMSQPQFASFIEDNLPDIVDPSQAEMLTLAREIQASTKGEFKSSFDERNGSFNLQYQKDIQGKTKNGDVEIPETFTVQVAPFRGSPFYELTARFRFRIEEDGELVIWYDLLRPHKAWEEAVGKVKTKLEDDLSLPVFLGSIG